MQLTLVCRNCPKLKFRVVLIIGLHPRTATAKLGSSDRPTAMCTTTTTVRLIVSRFVVSLPSKSNPRDLTSRGFVCLPTIRLFDENRMQHIGTSFDVQRKSCSNDNMLAFFCKTVVNRRFNRAIFNLVKTLEAFFIDKRLHPPNQNQPAGYLQIRQSEPKSANTDAHEPSEKLSVRRWYK